MRIFWLFFIFLFIAPLKTFASENFSISSNITYKVMENGLTHASFNIVLSNKNDKYYASSYKMKVGLENIKNVLASDPDGRLQTNLTKTNEGMEVELVFNRKVVGAGNSLSFNFSFDTEDIAQKQGNIWEINIPGIENQNDFSTFNVRLDVPSTFGSPAYIKPEIEINGLNFTKEALGKSGISLAFGEKQIYNFTLSYHLSNSRILPVKTEIAIPPTTNYQDVFIDSIYPRPSNVVRDSDGNWLAQYSLAPSEKMNITVKGKAQVFLYPKKEVLQQKQFKLYLKEKPYWEQNAKIKKIASDLKTPTAIYNYVVNTLTYDFSRLTDLKPRLGASSVFDNPSSAICMEFTDLFVALSRAAGIPAREVDGFAYTQNKKQRPVSLIKDILHAWPEYYDSVMQTWVMVDPTWGNTTKGVDYFNTLDFDHLAFVIKGKESDYPVPAGGYKLTNKDTKDVYVDFSDNIEIVNPKIQIINNIPDTAISSFPIKGSITVKNLGKSGTSKQLLTVETDSLFPKTTSSTVEEIPPYGFLEIPVSFKETPFLTNKEVAVKITLGKETIYQKIKVQPLFLSKISLMLGGVLIATIAIFLSITAARTWSLPFFRRQR